MWQAGGARSDGGDVDGAAPEEVALVVPGGDGAVLAEQAEGPLDGVPLLIGGGAAALSKTAAPADLKRNLLM
jgi:hypothetical protein